jgi:hypothetical protein
MLGIQTVIRFCAECQKPTRHTVWAGGGIAAYDCLPCSERELIERLSKEGTSNTGG